MDWNLIHILAAAFIIHFIGTECSAESNPKVGINLPHGSITFFGPTYGDTSGRPSPFYVTAAPNLATPSQAPSFPSSTYFAPFTFSTPAPYTPSPTSPFLSNPYSVGSSSANLLTTPRPQVVTTSNLFAQQFSASPYLSPSLSPFSFGESPQFNQYKPPQSTQQPEPQFLDISIQPKLEKLAFESKYDNFPVTSIEVTTEEDRDSFEEPTTVNKDKSLYNEDDATSLEDIEFGPSNEILDDNKQSSKKNLKEFWDSYNLENDEIDIQTLIDNGIGPEEYNRVARKIDIKKITGKGKNITALIKKALNLVKKVEQIDDRKKALESTISKSQSKSKEKEKDRDRDRDRSLEVTRDRDDERERALADLESLRDLKEEKRFNDLKSFIQDQSSASNLLRSETLNIRDLVESRLATQSKTNKKSTKDMIKALSKLNSISSLLLRDNDKTKSTVRQLPDEIRNIVESEVDDLRSLIEDQNVAVAQALRSAARFDERTSRKSSDADIVILKALSKLNRISGLLLEEQDKTEKQTKSALQAIPALAKFIQAETAEIKDRIEDQANDSAHKDDLEDLRGAVSQSLANDRLITRAVIKLNDITQLLLRDVNFTTTAITNKLPQALTALITSETGKIRRILDHQNKAIAEVLKESNNLKRAEQVIEEAQKIKSSIGNNNLIPNSQEAEVLTESDKLLEVLSPLINKNSKIGNDNFGKSNRAEKLVEILGPLLKKETKEELSEKQDENQAVLDAQLTGQKSIVQALIKLTNITRTLLEVKEKEDDNLDDEEPVPRFRERPLKEEPVPRFEGKPLKEEVRSSGGSRPPKKQSIRKEYDEYEIDKEYEDYYEIKDITPRRQNGRKKSLIERVATSSAGSRAIQGNQALFEEFVKLAIERQRWDQAQDVVKIIQDSVTTPKPEEDSEERNRKNKKGKGKGKKEKEEYSEEEYEDIDLEYSEEEYEEILPKQKPARRPTRRTTKRPQRLPPRRPKPTKPPRRTTTPTPVYEEYYSEEDYPEYDLSEEYDSLDFEDDNDDSESQAAPQVIEELKEESTSLSRNNNNIRNNKFSLSRGNSQQRERPRFIPPPRTNRPSFVPNSRRQNSFSPQSAVKSSQRLSINIKNNVKNKKEGKEIKQENKQNEIKEEKNKIQTNPKPQSDLVESSEEDPKEIEKSVALPADKELRTDSNDKNSAKSIATDLLAKLISKSKSSPVKNPNIDSISSRDKTPIKPDKKVKPFGRGRIAVPREHKTSNSVNKKIKPTNAPTTSRPPLEKQPPLQEKPKSLKESVLERLQGIAGNAKQSFQPTPAVPILPTSVVPRKKDEAIPFREAKKTITSKTKQVSSKTRGGIQIKKKKRPPQSDISIQTKEAVTESEPGRKGSQSESSISESNKFTSQRGFSRRPPQSDISIQTKETVRGSESGRKVSQSESKKFTSQRGFPKLKKKKDHPQSSLPPLVKDRNPDSEKKDHLKNLFSRNRPDNRKSQRGQNKRKPENSEKPNQISEESKPIKNKSKKKEKKMNPLENLFNIINSGSANDKKENQQTVVKVTSSSSSSSSNHPEGKKHIRKQGRKKKKGIRPRPGKGPLPTANPKFEDLSPQERLLQKVKETLNKKGKSAGNGNVIPFAPKEADIQQPKHSRKIKIRINKPGRIRNGERPREGRNIEESKLKTFKVRVRRVEEAAPFPVVY